MMSLKNENISVKVNAFKAHVVKQFKKISRKSEARSSEGKKNFLKTIFLNIIKLPYVLIVAIFSGGGGGGAAIKKNNKKHGTIKGKRGENSELVYYFEDDGKDAKEKVSGGMDLSGPIEVIANIVVSVSGVFVALLVPIFSYIKELSLLIAAFFKQLAEVLGGLLTVLTPLLWMAFLCIGLFFMGREVLKYFFSGLF